MGLAPLPHQTQIWPFYLSHIISFSLCFEKTHLDFSRRSGSCECVAVCKEER
jgi:hypothetical protein